MVRGDVGHCDVVIDVSSGGVKIIGGNVGNSVSERTVTRSKIQIKGADSYYGFISCNV